MPAIHIKKISTNKCEMEIRIEMSVVEMSFM